MTFSSKSLLLTTVSLAVLLLATAALQQHFVSAHAPITHSHLEKPDRKKFCGSDTDCVIIKEHGKSSQMRIDELDLMEDTIETVLKKMPPWFGPRPARFVHDHNVVFPGKPLAQQGIEIAGTLIIYKAEDHQLTEEERKEHGIGEHGAGDL